LTQSIGVNPGFFFSGCWKRKWCFNMKSKVDVLNMGQQIESKIKTKRSRKQLVSHKNYFQISHWNVFEMFHIYPSFCFWFWSCSPGKLPFMSIN
jgi:hypothetical protein